MATSRVIRTAVADYGDDFPGVLEVAVFTPDPVEAPGDPFLSVSPDAGDGGIVIGTKAQADQLIEAIQAGIAHIWNA